VLGFLVICLLLVFAGIMGWVTRRDNRFIIIRSPPYIPKNPHLGMSDMSHYGLVKTPNVTKCHKSAHCKNVKKPYYTNQTLEFTDLTLICRRDAPLRKESSNHDYFVPQPVGRGATTSVRYRGIFAEGGR
jgi:hypothetical protein